MNVPNDLTEIPVLRAIREELVAGIRRTTDPGAETPNVVDQAPRRRLVPRTRTMATVGGAAVALAAAILLVLALAPIGPSGPKPAAAFEVAVEADGRIRVAVHPDFDEAQQLADELEDAGIEVKVLTITAHPLLAGQVEFPDHPLADIGVERGDDEFWIDPDRFEAGVELLVYVAPAPGELWTQAPSVFHPDEPLGGLPCVLGGPLTTGELQERARSVGIDEFTWIVLSAPDETGSYMGLPARIGPNDPAPHGEVEEAHRVGPDRLEVSVIPPEVVAQIGPTATPSMNINLHGVPEPECTAELRSRW